jgi:predicted acetyltransferase
MITTLKEWKLFKNNINEKSTVNFKNTKHNNNYFMFDIYYNKIKSGVIELYVSNKELEIASIEIYKELRGKGIGSQAIKEIVKYIKSKYTVNELIADCLSQESFFSFIKALGKPYLMMSNIKDFTTYDEVKEFLPLHTTYDKDNHMIGGTDSSVFIRYKI